MPSVNVNVNFTVSSEQDIRKDLEKPEIESVANLFCNVMALIINTLVLGYRLNAVI